jgi:hypothetical protein
VSTGARTFKRGLKETQNLFRKSTQVVRRRFTRTTQKPSNSHLSGVAHYLQAQKSKASSLKCEEYAHGFLDFQGVVHYEFVPRGQTTNQHHYIGTLRRMRENV